uniref:Uncharacterized protein n=1 Tax=Anguilla anguilla TaxID=7936 RepID=A0A0E9P8S3_ANGAN
MESLQNTIHRLSIPTYSWSGSQKMLIPILPLANMHGIHPGQFSSQSLGTHHSLTHSYLGAIKTHQLT